MTTTEDTVAGPGCSLRAALRASDLDAPIGGCSAGAPGLDRVLIPAGVFTLASESAGADTADAGDLDVIGPVELIGMGRDATVLEAPGALGAADRVLEVGATGLVHLSGITLRGGQAAFGGGIHVGREGELFMTDCRVMDNEGEAGGGIHLAHGSLTMDRCEVLDNLSAAGGGLFETASHVTIRESVLAGNMARAIANASPGGGAIAGVGGTVRVETTQLLANAADDTRWGGGGILMHTGTLHVIRSTLADNSASDALADGSLADAARDETGGGALAAFGAVVRVENATFSGNRADRSRWGGGGILSFGSDTVASHTTFLSNSADGSGVDLAEIVFGGTLSDPVPGDAGFDYSVVVESSILAAGSPAECFSRSSSLRSATSSNAVDDASCAAVAPSIGPVTLLDPLLAFQGGPTPTHRLLAGSNAIDAGGTLCVGADGGPLPMDQRGASRPFNNACDLGAVEAAPEASMTAITGVSPSPSAAGMTATVSISVTGEFTRPRDGEVSVLASTGERCSDLSPTDGPGNTAFFACDLIITSVGTRTLVARFSDSSTHEGSVSEGVPHAVVGAHLFADGFEANDG